MTPEYGVSSWLEEGMRTRRISTRALAVRTGLTHSAVSRIRTGATADPSFSTVARLAQVLGEPLPIAGDPIKTIERALRTDRHLEQCHIEQVLDLVRRLHVDPVTHNLSRPEVRMTK